MDRLEGSKQSGSFTLSRGRKVLGELTLLGPKTSLYLHDKDEFSTLTLPKQCIRGVLHDLTKVSLIQCITKSGPGHAAQDGQEYWFATVFPHFVVYGTNHIGPDEKKIAKIHFATDDGTTLFYDFDAFGFLLDARPFIEEIANANAHVHGRTIVTGPNPEILYFAGKREIFAADTVLGRVSTSHNPRHSSLGGPSGVGLKNTIFVTIDFGNPLAFQESVARMFTVLRFLEMVAGRRQTILGLDLETQSRQRSSTILHVYWSMGPKDDPAGGEEKPHPSDVLIDAVRQPNEFIRVLSNWLDRDKTWRNARFRFSNSFGKQNFYPIERLVDAANMFDILPCSAVPPDVPVPKGLQAARETSRNAFRSLPASPERDSVLGILGRIGKASLKQKIRHRAAMIISEVGERFPQLLDVTDQAVDCRNYYVHGSEPKFDYNRNFDAVTFFIDTLEFVFAASDLVEAGWNIRGWSKSGTVMSHPFGRLLINYPEGLRQLKQLLRP